MLRKSLTNKGQVTVEVAVLFSAVVLALVLMGIYLQRAAQGGVKSNADSLGTQFSTTASWSTSTTSSSNSHETRDTQTTRQISNTLYNQTLQ